MLKKTGTVSGPTRWHTTYTCHEFDIVSVNIFGSAEELTKLKMPMHPGLTG